jgi:hypothetical protein
VVFVSQVLSGNILPIWSAIESAYNRYRAYNKSGFTVRIVRATIPPAAPVEGAEAVVKKEDAGEDITIIGIWVPQKQVNEVR